VERGKNCTEKKLGNGLTGKIATGVMGSVEKAVDKKWGQKRRGMKKWGGQVPSKLSKKRGDSGWGGDAIGVGRKQSCKKRNTGRKENNGVGKKRNMKKKRNKKGQQPKGWGKTLDGKEFILYCKRGSETKGEKRCPSRQSEHTAERCNHGTRKSEEKRCWGKKKQVGFV